MNNFEMTLTQKQVLEYEKAPKEDKISILNTYCKLTQIPRNTAVQRFRRAQYNLKPRVLKRRKRLRKGAPKKYTKQHENLVKKTWYLSGQVCSERLIPMITIYIDQLQKAEKLNSFTEEEIEVVKNISEATLKRMLLKFPKANYFKKHKGNSDIYKQVPMQAHFGKNADKTGFVEVDYVEHSGGNSVGMFCITGNYVDVCLQWVARSAGLGKNEASTRFIHENNSLKIFHKISEYHPDNCKTILKILLEKAIGNYEVSRSRPYKKDDNAHVEQKNDDKIRKLVGYHRYDTEKQAKILNKLYKVEDQITNYFTASQKLIRI